ncbi:TRAP transporter substrate-binding protein DctP [Brevibacterium spongiae]|uniref:TRAP transporter substrate-binding protein DctP n=1 Tax=Brevibacterium spongiae TaxID=2909672 RepID=A0ABY5SQ77_9MICO|nr:TRAP transporter substrate-binding protein DctP [Brevibacterium spongiae]UVI36683.1 TRAP transporter substrate-binding protein DctP [Brevibacterium spongiae]
MKRRQILASAAAFALSIAVGGCATSDNDGALILRVAGQNNDHHPNTTELRKMAQTVEEGTSGRVRMEIYPNNQLGDYTLMYDEIGQGTMHMGLISTPTNLDNRLEIQFLPYLFTNYQDVNRYFTLDSVLGKQMREIHGEQDIELLGLFAEGFGGIATSKPASEPAKMGVDKDVVLRVPEIPITAGHTKSMGFSTVSMAYADVYQGLQTGAVDGWTGGHPLVNYLQFKDVISHYYQYNNMFEATHLLINRPTFQSLSKADQQVLRDAGETLTKNSFEISSEAEDTYRKKMADEGIEVVNFDEKELKDFAKYAQQNAWSVLNDPGQVEMIKELADEMGFDYSPPSS